MCDSVLCACVCVCICMRGGGVTKEELSLASFVVLVCVREGTVFK